MISPVEDVDRIMAVMAAAFDPAYGEAWNRRQVEDALLVGNCHYLLIGVEGKPLEQDSPAAGFSLTRRSMDEEELLLFAVIPQFRHRGFGRRMLDRLAEDARDRGISRIILEMRRGNPAEKLYRNFGFTPVGERPKYYHGINGEAIDAITFAYTIE